MTRIGNRFNGKVAFITGIARGQGREHSVRLAAEGAKIIGVDVCAPFASTTYVAATEDDLAETVETITAAGGSISAHLADVRDVDALRQALEAGLSEFGRLDLVVANAAICSFGRLWELTETQWHETIDVNLTGVWNTLRLTVPVLLDQGEGGSIVVTSSGAGLKGLPMLSAYGASKWAITGMARTLANEVGDQSIRVNTIHPTAVKTPMGKDPSLKGVFGEHPEFLRSYGNLLPVGSIPTSSISDTVLWLLSDEARFITGAAIPIDAGSMQI